MCECETCTELSKLLNPYKDSSEKHDSSCVILPKSEVNQLIIFVQAFMQRQCLGGFQDRKHYDQFQWITQCFVLLMTNLLKAYKGENRIIYPLRDDNDNDDDDGDDDDVDDDDDSNKWENLLSNVKEEELQWTVAEIEKPLHLLTKVFLMNYPLYVAVKQYPHYKAEEVTQQEASTMNHYCDVQEIDMPLLLLRNVNMFCRVGGMEAVMSCFDYEILPLTMANPIVILACNVKLWLNYHTNVHVFAPLRSKVLRFMCNLTDKELRTPAAKTMADFMWSSNKDGHTSNFDKDGLELAFKYFTSPTLTMRLAGISQINSHIGSLNELVHVTAATLSTSSQSNDMITIEQIGHNLATWLVHRKIISHIFGPNLHVEVIKQCSITLNFLASEGKITNEHIDTIWQAAQLKHCSKQVFDLLPGFIKHLEPGPVLHLYHLLRKLEPKEHTEQSLFLASALTKFIWSSMATTGKCHEFSIPKMSRIVNTRDSHRIIRSNDMSTSENSASLNSNSDGETSEERSDLSDGPTPRKKLKKGNIFVYSDNEEAKIFEELSNDYEFNEKEIIRPSKPLGMCKIMRCVRKKTIRDTRMRVTKPCNSSDDDSDKIQLNHCKLVKENKLRKSRGKLNHKKMCNLKMRCLTTGCTEDESESEGEDEDDDDDDDEEEEDDDDDDDDDEDDDIEDEDSESMEAMEIGISPIDPTSDQQVPSTLINRQMLEDYSGDENSMSSRMSNKSDKNMADFDGEDSGCDEELLQLAARAQTHLSPQQLNHMAFHSNFQSSKCVHPSTHSITSTLSNQFNIENVCKPGSTLLWDLLQDENITLLGESLALEAEKALFNLVCFNTDRAIRMKFIEGCLDNIQKNKAVVISLRLLPKLFASFHQFRGASLSNLNVGMDTRQVTLWAVKHHSMIDRVFNNFREYCKQYADNNFEDTGFYTHQTHIEARLQFLTHIYSSIGLPDSIKLTIDELDTLWDGLVNDEVCKDELFNWLLRQVRCREQHTFNVETLTHLYCEKLLSLAPENYTMIALSLFTQLCNMAQQQVSSEFLMLARNGHAAAMEHLSKIALKASNNDVSMAAIQYMNSYYMMNLQLDKEDKFISECVANLSTAVDKLNDIEESSLLYIQRALVLLKTHLETFKRKYAYHLRRWTLEGHGIMSHVIQNEKNVSTIRLNINPAMLDEKLTLDMPSTDYIADMRAEIAHWWENQHDILTARKLPTDGNIRMIALGQEITSDFDEKTIQETGLKDNQIIYLSLSTSRKKKFGDQDLPGSMQTIPSKESSPTLLLLRPKNFEVLFRLMHTLGSMKSFDNEGKETMHSKAQVLSRNVWDILTMLPTSPTMLECFRHFPTRESKENCKIWLEKDLDSSNLQKLMYSLYIIESLLHHTSDKVVYDDSDELESSTNGKAKTWGECFIEKGGLEHLFTILMSGTLQGNSEWHQDCLAHLLKLLCQLGVSPNDRKQLDQFEGLGFDPYFRSRKANMKKQTNLVVPKLNQEMLKLMKIDLVIPRLMSILNELSFPRYPKEIKTGFWGRAQVIHFLMTLVLSWSHSINGICEALLESNQFSMWLCNLVLEDPDPLVRHEICVALYRLCAVTPANRTAATLLLSQLIKFLDKAECMKPQIREENLLKITDEEKLLYGHACRDYFWLMCRLVNCLSNDIIQESLKSPSECIINIEALAVRVWESIASRDFIETDYSGLQDDGLIGLLNLMSNILGHKPPFKFSKHSHKVIDTVFEFLFALPDPQNRQLPKCKSESARSSAYDLLVELVKETPNNYEYLYEKLLEQHSNDFNRPPYFWDYWPHDDGRSNCGYVGLTNLGATCYMASCMQHLFMMPQARRSILEAKCDESNKHNAILIELKRMFAYLLESERKTYNPRSFCKVYTMDHQLLNTGEQKDMAEFFIDLVSKLEEMTPELKTLVKTLFGGVISNNVVSLDCDHVSRTLEEFYTVRCQVSDMRNLYESLDEVTLKDTLDGDNMYTCSQCEKKVRAEKRACFKKLPQILCFNTMRYTFNMITMMKEKVNTHFSFPMILDMSGYVEKHLMPQHYLEEKEMNENDGTDRQEENYQYELIGVTVHTGTADGGHYYSFIRNRERTNRSQTPSTDQWYLFNDAEVKLFDASQLAAECFGGEMTSKTYDSVTDKYMDLSFEKTNSAYMLFYELVKPTDPEIEDHNSYENQMSPPIKLSSELEGWIWQDNRQFLQDKNIFESAYFQFMWQICAFIPHSLEDTEELSELATKLTAAFFLETYIHAKERSTIMQWTELLIKQFSASQSGCEWFLQQMGDDGWWPLKIFVKCSNQVIRQTFLKLCMHAIQCIRPYVCFFKNIFISETKTENLKSCVSCLTSFIQTVVSLMQQNIKNFIRNMTEYFTLLHEFSKLGDEESKFLISIQCITTVVNFYLSLKGHEQNDISNNGIECEDEDEEIIPLTTIDRNKPPLSLEKLIALVVTLIEKSRGIDGQLELSDSDLYVLQGMKGFPFIIQQIKDNTNLHMTKNIIFSLCRNESIQKNSVLANEIICQILNNIQKNVNNTEIAQPFFKMLTLLSEGSVGGNGGLPPFTEFILKNLWQSTENGPQVALEWLSLQVPRNKQVSAWVLNGMDTWVERYLMAHGNARVRSGASVLLVSLVPNTQFRQAFRSARGLCLLQKEIVFAPDAKEILQEIFKFLLKLLKVAKEYTDTTQHGSSKMTAYFVILNYFLVSKVEKLMFGPHLVELWQLFHPKLSEPAIPIHHNKQSLLMLFYNVLTDCVENVQILIQDPYFVKNIAFNYILADHDDQEVVIFNRTMLPAYYGLLRICCQHSRSFTRQLAGHQNISWAFKNISPHPTQYAAAVDELFKLLQLFIKKYPDSTEQEISDINQYRRETIQLYVSHLDGKAGWGTLIPVTKILLENDDDKVYFVQNQGLEMCFEGFQTLHNMYHEATACHVTGDLIDMLALIVDVTKCLQKAHEQNKLNEKETPRSIILGYKEWPDLLRKLVTLLNTYNPKEMRHSVLDLLKILVVLMPVEVINVLQPILTHCHAVCMDSSNSMPIGPYFPRRGHKVPMLSLKSNTRPIRPMVQMALTHNQLDLTKGCDSQYDADLSAFYSPYHEFIDLMCRTAVNNDCLTEPLVTLSAMIGYESIPLHHTFFPKFWLDVHSMSSPNLPYLRLLSKNNYFVDYLESTLIEERLSLNNDIIYDFVKMFFPEMAASVLSHHTFELLESIIFNLPNDLEKLGELETEKRMLSNLRALQVCSLVKPPVQELKAVLNNIKISAKNIITKIINSKTGKTDSLNETDDNDFDVEQLSLLRRIESTAIEFIESIPVSKNEELSKNVDEKNIAGPQDKT
ncbi:ubiquitin carboxyl-terminal hydrolase 34 [Daktulosphaira vitifoliae]|uniref:ubiquitin carboxyl-terminal hydrolase 34 n=1 Tax=Daktulosphaira vitifoliae TaxID=58002 RepID=UPI0021AAF641|nr:ubiquitin carboxyl-terminal hydrolase 34 [Daktulosphaira vitifoliae]